MTRHTSQAGFAGIVALVVLAAIGVAAFSFYGYAVGVRNEALGRETRLSAVYESNQVEVSNMVSTVYEQVGVANLKSDKMDQIIKDALVGRYGDDGFKGGSFAAAITEASQDTKGLDIYDKVLPTISSLREGVRNKQNLLIDSAREYDNWRKQGIVRAWILSGVYPSKDLKITVGDKTYYGQEALDKLQKPIVTSSTVDAFEKGTMEPMTFPGSASPKK